MQVSAIDFWFRIILGSICLAMIILRAIIYFYDKEREQEAEERERYFHTETEQERHEKTVRRFDEMEREFKESLYDQMDKAPIWNLPPNEVKMSKKKKNEKHNYILQSGFEYVCGGYLIYDDDRKCNRFMSIRTSEDTAKIFYEYENEIVEAASISNLIVRRVDNPTVVR